MKELNRFKLKMPATPVRGHLASGGKASGREPSGTSAEDVIREYAAPKRREARSLLLVDATGSMASHWEHLKTNLDEIVGRLLSVGNDSWMKFVAYRDECDGDKLIEQSPWQKDAAKLKEFIGRIQCNGGGDWPEAVDRALRVALEDQNRPTSVVLIGDAPPHSDRAGVVEAVELGKRQCPVYSIVVGGAEDTRAAFTEISRSSGGTTISLEKLEELYDILGVILAHGMGEAAFREYLARYRARLGSGATAAARLLIADHGPKR